MSWLDAPYSCAIPVESNVGVQFCVFLCLKFLPCILISTCLMPFSSVVVEKDFMTVSGNVGN